MSEIMNNNLEDDVENEYGFDEEINEKVYSISRLKKVLKDRQINVDDTVLLKNFYLEVIDKIKETYLDCIDTEEEIEGHFRWCFNFVIKEKYGSSKKLVYKKSAHSNFFEKQFLNFVELSFYESKNEEHIDYMKDYIEELFDTNSPKKEREVKELEMLYKNFSKVFIKKDLLPVKKATKKAVTSSKTPTKK